MSDVTRSFQWEQETGQGAWGDLLGVLERHTRALGAMVESQKELATELHEQKEWLMRLKLAVTELTVAVEQRKKSFC